MALRASARVAHGGSDPGVGLGWTRRLENLARSSLGSSREPRLERTRDGVSVMTGVLPRVTRRTTRSYGVPLCGVYAIECIQYTLAGEVDARHSSQEKLSR